MRFEGKVKEYNQGTKRNAFYSEQIEERLHLASIMLCINTANRRQRGRLRPQGNKRWPIEARKTGDGNESKEGEEGNKTRDRNEIKQGIETKGKRGRSETKQGTGRERRRKKQKGVIATSGEKKECLHQQQAFQIRQRGIRTYRRADKEVFMASWYIRNKRSHNHQQYPYFPTPPLPYASNTLRARFRFGGNNPHNSGST